MYAESVNLVLGLAIVWRLQIANPNCLALVKAAMKYFVPTLAVMPRLGMNLLSFRPNRNQRHHLRIIAPVGQLL
jgi:hypothetical protein